MLTLKVPTIVNANKTRIKNHIVLQRSQCQCQETPKALYLRIFPLSQQSNKMGPVMEIPRAFGYSVKREDRFGGVLLLPLLSKFSSCTFT